MRSIILSLALLGAAAPVSAAEATVVRRSGGSRDPARSGEPASHAGQDRRRLARPARPTQPRRHRPDGHGLPLRRPPARRGTLRRDRREGHPLGAAQTAGEWVARHRRASGDVPARHRHTDAGGGGRHDRRRTRQGHPQGAGQSRGHHPQGPANQGQRPRRLALSGGARRGNRHQCHWLAGDGPAPPRISAATCPPTPSNGPSSTSNAVRRTARAASVTAPTER